MSDEMSDVKVNKETIRQEKLKKYDPKGYLGSDKQPLTLIYFCRLQ